MRGPARIAVAAFLPADTAAALLGCLWNDPVIAEEGISNEKARPDAVILGYPVITSEKGKCHEGSFECLLGDALEEKRGEMSLETRVGEKNPPTFLWHTAADQAVPVASSLRMAAALAEHKVPFELHVFPRGNHGLSLANRRSSGGNPDGELPEVAQWMRLCKDWLQRTL